MRLILSAALLAAMLFSSTGFASQASGEISHRQAALLAAACFNCHGTDGRWDRDSIPPIAGRSQTVLTAQLLAFRADETPNTTVMNRIAKGFTEAELRAIAQYFSAIKD